MLDVASLAMRLWNEHRDSANLPDWEVVGLEVLEKDLCDRRSSHAPRVPEPPSRTRLRSRPMRWLGLAHVGLRLRRGGHPCSQRRPLSWPWPPGPPRTLPSRRWPRPCSQDATAILAANARRRRRPLLPAARPSTWSTGCASTPPGSRGWPRVCATSPALPDPVGEVVRGSTLANGLQLRQVRVPFGVVGIIYEARPNVTADAAGICLKSGNAVLLRGSSSALQLQHGDRRRAAPGGSGVRPARGRRPAGARARATTRSRS